MAYEKVAEFLLAKGPRVEEAEFKRLLFDEYDLKDHPKREKIYRLAYDYGHSGGWFQVLYYFDDFADLLRED